MNAKDNITETINALNTSVQFLYGNSIALRPLAEHTEYGEQIKDILDQIQVQQNKVIGLTNEVLTLYEDRYKEDLKEVDSLTASLKADLNG